MEKTRHFLFSRISGVSARLLFIIICASCGGGELSRSKVKSFVEQSPEFVQPLTVDLTNSYEVKPSTIDKISAAETVEQAKARDLKSFLESYPDIDAARHLGFTDLEQILVREDAYVTGRMEIPSWYLTRRVRANEKGRQLWRDLQLPVKDDSLPVGKKRFGEVTGITKQGETQAIADFTFRWVPNELGKALDPNTEEFKQLPEEVRRRLTQKKGLFQTSDSADWSGERQGKALFQKYDDGWRLVRVF